MDGFAGMGRPALHTVSDYVSRAREMAGKAGRRRKRQNDLRAFESVTRPVAQGEDAMKTYDGNLGMLFPPPPSDMADLERVRQMQAFSATEARREAQPTGREKETLYNAIIAWTRKHGDFTADELAAAWRCNPNHVAPRISELLTLGRLVETGARRKTRSGHWAAVLKEAR